MIDDAAIIHLEFAPYSTKLLDSDEFQEWMLLECEAVGVDDE